MKMKMRSACALFLESRVRLCVAGTLASCIRRGGLAGAVVEVAVADGRTNARAAGVAAGVCAGDGR